MPRGALRVKMFERRIIAKEAWRVPEFDNADSKRPWTRSYSLSSRALQKRVTAESNAKSISSGDNIEQDGISC